MKWKQKFLTCAVILLMVMGCGRLDKASDQEKALDAEGGVYSKVKDIAGGLHPAGQAVIGLLGTLALAFGAIKGKEKLIDGKAKKKGK